MRGTDRRRGRPLLVGATALALALALGACTSVRNDLGTSNSGCFVALPAASAAVHGGGHLEGVRLVNVAWLKSHDQGLYDAVMAPPGPPAQQVCLVAFTGQFVASAIAKPIGEPQGHLAVVELVYPDNLVLATLLLARPPLRFGHSHIGVL